MVCPFCFQVGMAAANYELGALVKHIARRHPWRGVLVSVVGTVVIVRFGPRVWRAITTA
jgi:hypothetical protein